jgi:hypothetical protein
MEEFDQLFRTHKDSFDRLEPRAETWTAIKHAAVKPSTEHTPRLFRRPAFLSIAAAILLVLGFSSIWLLRITPGRSAFKDIALASPYGETITLDPSENKFTLVQFWASGNAICTEDNCYYFLPAYEKYKDQGFEIYAISLDEDKDSWVSGIEENQLPWIHVSDLKGMDSPICIECNITKVPTNFLLNQKGKIIARDLEAQDLERTLSKLLAKR